MHIIFMFFGMWWLATIAQAEGVIVAETGPKVNGEGCDFFQDADFSGPHLSVVVGINSSEQNVSYVGDRWNDQISSIACWSNCYAIVWEDGSFGGASRTFQPNVRYVGDDWNDKISALRVRCRREATRTDSPGTPSWCNEYAINAVNAYQVGTSGANKNSCNIQTGPRWQPNKENHYRWCLGVSHNVAFAEQQARQNILVACGARKPPQAID